MSSKKIYNFTVPVSGQECFAVIAESYEEAIEKINNGEYYEEPELHDIDWNFGLGHNSEEYLPKCYTISKVDPDKTPG